MLDLGVVVLALNGILIAMIDTRFRRVAVGKLSVCEAGAARGWSESSDYTRLHCGKIWRGGLLFCECLLSFMFLRLRVSLGQFVGLCPNGAV